MVNNSTSIKLIITSHLKPWKIKKSNHYNMMLEIQVLAWDRYNNVVGLNWLQYNSNLI
jgi:hypothetical protein